MIGLMVTEENLSAAIGWLSILEPDYRDPEGELLSTLETLPTDARTEPLVYVELTQAQANSLLAILAAGQTRGGDR